jgi:hypothetical protein
MKKLFFTFMLCASFAQAQTVGQGEYRFGPDMAENAACELAKEKAKENVIANYVGEQLELSTTEYCKNEKCVAHSITLSDVSGQIKRIIKMNSVVAPERGHSVCVVDIVADVEKINNPIEFKLIDPESELRHGDRFTLKAISNRVGITHVFNFVDDKYHLIYRGKVTTPNKEFNVLPTNERFSATVPQGKKVSKELVVILFTTTNLTVGEMYSRIEFQKLIKDVPFNGRKLVNHHVTIVR